MSRTITSCTGEIMTPHGTCCTVLLTGICTVLQHSTALCCSARPTASTPTNAYETTAVRPPVAAATVATHHPGTQKVWCFECYPNLLCCWLYRDSRGILHSAAPTHASDLPLVPRSCCSCARTCMPHATAAHNLRHHKRSTNTLPHMHALMRAVEQGAAPRTAPFMERVTCLLRHCRRHSRPCCGRCCMPPSCGR
jgi:hypothetical protein